MKISKIALVTGGSRGIGKNIALSLAQKGIQVLLTYQSNQVEAQTTVAEIEALGQKAIALPLNVADISSFDAFSQQVTSTLQTVFNTDRFDFLINNAGTGFSAPILETTEAQFDEMMNIHLKGVYFLTQKMLPSLNDGGRIVNVSSGVTRYSYPGVSAYGIMKGAVEVFTRYLALELGARGISANVVAPGAVFGGGAMIDTPAMREYVAGITALGRVGLPDDVGGVVAFLCSEDAKWVNGQRIEVTGGMNL
ncbi:NAD(P)-dependent dehydrogenase (short-subunit alcohol dehydrogenase family) [Larkinella arboricola]|uniref:NAD(P)-dependent dehydrogenase (Short-subunit alcohol dehydrogenase family) n=1 Tax=Larkinella arboricola TaxID=643671 RepID=A0A327X4I6_LARAB|nr:SDR family oxidoreductase [Larkinella arboricola]RAJ97828.1 NAD(P)-dependent dehydrogenase (short-subunit alcohol dehydrogenase family) [Larkinella arboricola]